MLWKKILSLTLFKIISVSRSSTLLRIFLMGRSRCPTMGDNWGVGLPPASVKVLTPPFFWIHPPPHQKIESPCPSRDHWPFKEILAKFFPATCIFSYTIVTYLKSSLELNPVIENSVQQSYLPELYSVFSRILPEFPRAKFAFLPPFNAIWKTLLFLMLVLIFFQLPFLFQAL